MHSIAVAKNIRVWTWWWAKWNIRLCKHEPDTIIQSGVHCLPQTDWPWFALLLWWTTKMEPIRSATFFSPWFEQQPRIIKIHIPMPTLKHSILPDFQSGTELPPVSQAHCCRRSVFETQTIWRNKCWVKTRIKNSRATAIVPHLVRIYDDVPAGTTDRWDVILVWFISHKNQPAKTRYFKVVFYILQQRSQFPNELKLLENYIIGVFLFCQPYVVPLVSYTSCLFIATILVLRSSEKFKPSNRSKFGSFKPALFQFMHRLQLGLSNRCSLWLSMHIVST